MSSVSVLVRPTELGRKANIGLLVLQVLLAAAFLVAGAFKLAGAEVMVKQFEAIGLGQWLRYLTGVLEIAAAVLIVLPGWSGYGALLLLPIMLGAAAAHVIVFKNSPAAPLVFLVLAAVIAWGRLGRPRAGSTATGG